MTVAQAEDFEKIAIKMKAGRPGDVGATILAGLAGMALDFTKAQQRLHPAP